MIRPPTAGGPAQRNADSRNMAIRKAGAPHVPGAVTAAMRAAGGESGATKPRPGRDVLPPLSRTEPLAAQTRAGIPVQSKSRSVFQTACMMTASLRATATVVRRSPIRTTIARPQLRSVLSVTLRVRMAFAAWNR
jgi:hypothetical protein